MVEHRFKAWGPEDGHRLDKQLELGPGNYRRRFVDVEEEKAVAATPPVRERVLVARSAVGEVKKRGRPRVEGVRPWEAEGISRRTWFRRRKEGGG